ncbi:MAG: RagB/SusD family nutrient uptake outer membrane protein [Bacteroidales bacterium]|jgi:hypothetical protein|nr:RagB/SusD family nutrient uptake outer membrane protein [Bacteroidales bacterium]
MKFLKYIWFSLSVLLFGGCADYLDVVPEGTATLESSFSNRPNSEKFFYSCYNNLPNMSQAFEYPGYIAGGDEIWFDVDNNMKGNNGARLAQGQQNITDPYLNYWDGAQGGKNMWVGIRNCNIFLENIDKVPDLREDERIRWKAEIKFLKAYFHFFLLQMYGPIPIVETNIDVSASPEEVRIYREPVDDVIEYIVRLIDEATPDLPLYIQEISNETGRVTQAAAVAIKAKVLVWAASPLVNGSYTFYSDFKDKRGVQLIANNPDPAVLRARWQRAAEAVKNAIDTAHLAGHALFHFQRGFDMMSDTTLLKYTLRGCVTERGATFNNMEVIWGYYGNDNNQFQNWSSPKIYQSYAGTAELSATMKMAETYYTRNGLPIDEDPYWEYDTRYTTRADTGTWHRYYVGAGETTARLNYYREPRFYAHLGFDRGIYEYFATPEDQALVIKQRSGEVHGLVYQDCHPSTGYFMKKHVNFRNPTTTNGPSPVRFAPPIVRLPDLYLLYAETLNELLPDEDAQPGDEIYQWVDSIRVRAGLNKVVESWQWSSNPGKPNRKASMREIIKRERLIELSFEGQRPFDLRRWRDAEKYMNEPVRGWDFQGSKIDDYYLTTIYFSNRNFTYKDYLWPLRSSTLTVNSNLVQNPGW